MKRTFLTLVALCLMGIAGAQSLLQEDFSNGIPLSWTLINDGHTPHSELGNAYRDAWVQEASAGNPAPCAVSISYFNPVDTADRWLITPQVVVPDSGYFLSFDVAVLNSSYPDGIKVFVSPTGGLEKEDFADTLLDVNSVSAVYNGTWDSYLFSMDEYVGDTITVAFVQQSYDRVAIALDNVFIGVMPARSIQLTAIDVPVWTPVDSILGTVSGTIASKGLDTLRSFTVTYYAGTDPDNLTLVDTREVNCEVLYNGSYTFSHDGVFTPNTLETYYLRVVVSNPNGLDDADSTDNSMVGTTKAYNGDITVDRTVLIEQFTGKQCIYCPYADSYMEQALSNLNWSPRVDYTYVIHHVGYYEDDLTVAPSRPLTVFYNSTQGTYAPAFMFDRTHLTDDPGPVTNGTASPTTHARNLTTASEVPCFLTLSTDGVNFTESDRSLTGTVTGHFTDHIYGESTRIMVYIVEDSLIMDQAYRNMQTGQSYYITGYTHYNVLRAALTANFGDAIEVDDDGNFSFDVNYTLPDNMKAWRCRLVAFVYNYDGSNVNNCPVYQSAMTPNFNATYGGIDEVGTEISLSVYPNPATHVVNIEASEPISDVTVMNVMGQTVYSNTNANGTTVQVNTTNLPGGIYIATVKTATGTATHRFTVVR